MLAPGALIAFLAGAAGAIYLGDDCQSVTGARWAFASAAMAATFGLDAARREPVSGSPVLVAFLGGWIGVMFAAPFFVLGHIVSVAGGWVLFDLGSSGRWAVCAMKATLLPW